MRCFIKSLCFFFRSLFKKKEVDVIFYYPQHFNRGRNSENMFFDHLYKTCKKHKLSYLVFEEPDYSSNKRRNNNVIPFDFFYWIIIFLRKFIKSDYKIGRFLSKSFLRGISYNNCIVISQSMISFFYGLNPKSRLFDLQHGIIHKKKLSYIKNGEVADNLRNNHVGLFLFGEEFRSILLNNDSSGYFLNHSYVIGIPQQESSILHQQVNTNILVTLQFTQDHTDKENNLLATELESFIQIHQEYNFFLRNHPRYNNEVDLDRFLKYKNVMESNNLLIDCFKECSIHLTSYSTTTFEAASFGIPTIFLNTLSDDFNMFHTEFNYPIENNLQSIKLEYKKSSFSVRSWQKDFFSVFDENKFISLLS